MRIATLLQERGIEKMELTTEFNEVWNSKDSSYLDRANSDRESKISTSETSSSKNDFKPFGHNGLSFSDIVDMANPLHHIPVLGSIYRHITGDQIAPVPRITGGSIFFGPIVLRLKNT